MWASAQAFGIFLLSAYAQKPVLLKFVRGYGVGEGVLVCMWGVWFTVFCGGFKGVSPLVGWYKFRQSRAPLEE